jgi:hypothetical protein
LKEAENDEDIDLVDPTGNRYFGLSVVSSVGLESIGTEEFANDGVPETIGLLEAEGEQNSDLPNPEGTRG